MRKILKWAVRILGVVALLIAGFALYIQIDGIPKYKAEKIDLTVEVTPERVVRGKKWAGLLCAECHLNPETNQLTGHLMTDAPPEFGVVYSKNITKHPVKGIGAWTDGELVYFLRTGVRRDGQYAPPPMPKLRMMADDDLLSIVAFLRSDDGWVAAADVDDQESVPSFLVKFLTHVAFKPRDYPKEKIVAPAASDKLAYGRYLANSLQCYDCHSASFKSNKHIPDEAKSAGFMGGGNMLLDLAGKKVYTPNITPDEGTGIGAWSDAQFRRAIKGGFRPNNTPLLYPMPRYAELSTEEVDAIYAYLRTVPKLVNTRTPAEYEAPSGLTGGKAVYYKYRCDSCHGEKGIGACDLRQATKKFPTTELMTAFLKKPESVYPVTGMPSWEGVIAEDEYAPLTAYVKSLEKK